MELVPALVRGEQIGHPVEDEASAADAVGIAPHHGAEIGRMSRVIVDRLEAEHDRLRACRRGHDEIADDRAPGEDAHLRSVRKRQRDLGYVDPVERAEGRDHLGLSLKMLDRNPRMPHSDE